MYDLLLKGAVLIDPAMEIHAQRDIAIAGGKISAIKDDIPVSKAHRVSQLKGKLITPGLIDIHCHPVGDFLDMGVGADEIGVNSGVTMVCDAGSF